MSDLFAVASTTKMYSEGFGTLVRRRLANEVDGSDDPGHEPEDETSFINPSRLIE